MRSSGRRLGSVHGAKSRFEPAICPHSDARSGFSPDYLTQIRPAANAGVTLCALSAGSVSFIPDGAWVTFAMLRFFVGFGVGAAASVAVPLIVEYTPTRHRTVVTSATVIPVSLGILAASLSAATLLHQIGWRGLAALGFLPLVPALLIALIMPETKPAAA